MGKGGLTWSNTIHGTTVLLNEHPECGEGTRVKWSTNTAMASSSRPSRKPDFQ